MASPFENIRVLDQELCIKGLLVGVYAFCSRFGLYTLKTIYEGHPAYIRPVSGQAFFYKRSFDKWDYFHKLERWIIGEEVRR